ncbi:MAG: hypothetical protein ACI8RZ_004505, partial [Myxococcota bacterium]
MYRFSPSGDEKLYSLWRMLSSNAFRLYVTVSRFALVNMACFWGEAEEE